MKPGTILTVLSLALVAVLSAMPMTSIPAQAADKLDRTVLPIPEPNYPHSTVFDARKATAPPRFEVKAPANAPNVLIVLIDDMGFGMSSSFGGPIHMPTAERLADNGLRCSAAATITPTTWAASPKSRPRFPAIRGAGPTTWRHWPRCCG